MAKSHESFLRRRAYPVTSALGVVALVVFGIVKPIGERDTENDFNSQYGGCLTDTFYHDGNNAVASGVFWFGDTKVTLSPAETSTTAPQTPTRPLEFVLEDGGFKPADEYTQNVVAPHYCPDKPA